MLANGIDVASIQSSFFELLIKKSHLFHEFASEQVRASAPHDHQGASNRHFGSSQSRGAQIEATGARLRRPHAAPHSHIHLRLTAPSRGTRLSSHTLCKKLDFIELAPYVMLNDLRSSLCNCSRHRSKIQYKARCMI